MTSSVSVEVMIKELRDRGMSLAQIADKLDISRAGIYKWLSGKCEPEEWRVKVLHSLYETAQK